MINEYIVQYYFGKLRLKYGRLGNERFCLYVSAHDKEEAEKLAKMQIRCSQNRHGEINIIEIVEKIIDG
jgi:hypothetical protein